MRDHAKHGCNLHFAIGHDNGEETRTIETFDYPDQALAAFKKAGYSEKDGYFIDIWMNDETGLPFPVADIKVEDWSVEQSMNWQS